MNQVFADTFFYLALFNERDRAHDRALRLSLDRTTRFVTSAWVMTELADAWCGTRRDLFTRTYDSLIHVPTNIFITASEKLWNQAVDLYSSRPDKAWSLTDCTSFVIMKRLRIREAATGDRHFAQAGFKALLA